MGWFLIVGGVFAWVLAGPLLEARGWNPALSWEENVFRVRTLASFFGLLGLALLLWEPASTLLPSHLFTSHLAGLTAAFVGAGTLTWSITLLRRHQSPNVLVVLATVAVWLPVIALAFLLDRNRTHIAAGGVLSGVLLSVGSWIALLVGRQSQGPGPGPLA